MRKLSVTKLKPRMTLAKGIYTGDGRILLPTGTILQDSYIERLNQLDLKFVFITDELLAKAQIKEVISEPAWIDLQQAVRDLFNKVGKIHGINFDIIRQALDNIIYEIISNRDRLSNYCDWGHGEPLANHSVNVCILALMMGLKREYNIKQLEQLATGALLHDIGKALNNNSPQKTTGDHTTEGFQFLKDNDNIPLLSAHVAYQHHEKWDGSGLPRHLKGEAIHEYARIVAVADTYDSLIREHDLPPWAVIDHLKTLSGNSLDSELVELFLSIIPTFPLGTTVQLSTNEKGVVVDIPQENPDRPVVWMTDYFKQQTRELRLAEIPQINVIGIIID
ncbi:MAG: HD domain-containing protein [Clostridia bacterium]|nr:HD domain-containing protein [Clostridia bacterium]